MTTMRPDKRTDVDFVRHCLVWAALATRFIEATCTGLADNEHDFYAPVRTT